MYSACNYFNLPSDHILDCLPCVCVALHGTNRYSALDDEIYIGGIYVRIFLQQPQFKVRRPEKFIEGLFEQHEKLAVAEGMAKDLGAVATGVHCDAEPVSTARAVSSEWLWRVFAMQRSLRS